MGFSYEYLNRVANSTPPYRGTVNRFPLWKRSDLRRYFFTATENGETVFDIGYGHTWNREELPPDEGAAAVASGDPSVYEYNPYHNNGEPTYIRHTKIRNIIGRVRADNTIEFTADALDQGDRYFISQLSYSGYVNNDSRRGGVIFSKSVNRTATQIYPICRGVRYENESFTPKGNFEVVLRTVKRGVARDLVASHEKFFKVSEAMASALIGESVWMDTAHNIAMDYIPEHKNEYFIRQDETKKILDKAVGLMNDAPLDAMVLFAIAHNVRSMRGVLLDNRSAHRMHDDAMLVCGKVKRLVTKDLYLRHPDMFVDRIYTGGHVFPQSSWGVRVFLDGQEKEQYGYSATKS